ncbi:TPA: hypothetical protein DDZ86_02650 [Candidatus Dependentiae bacterium]|nr:MAG: hypothetical protein UW09_C0001G0119 [candidate division TM6 bacterium GW2011_GWF2_43_87]HBL98518.1 hypothetical protein [Candidatus Dependentiae bacterium]
MAFASLSQLLGSAFPVATENWPARLAREWTTAVGDLGERMRLERVMGTTLIIGVFDSHWIQELFMLTPLIIQTINQHLGKPFVTRIRFVVADKKKTPHHLCHKGTPTGEPRVKKVMSGRHELVLRSIKDVQLQEALEKFFYNCVV